MTSSFFRSLASRALAPVLLASFAAAQGTAYYIPDPDPTTGSFNIIPFGTVASQPLWANQRYQTIVTAADLGNAPGVITGLSFASNGTGTHTTQSLRITMAHVPAGFSVSSSLNRNFDNNLQVLGTGATAVLDRLNYAWYKTSNTWSSVGLDTSFSYNGTDDLLIDILAIGNNNSNGRGGMRKATRLRLFDYGWTGSPPTSGQVDRTALKMQIQMGCTNLSLYGLGCKGLSLSLSGSSALGQTVNVAAAGGLVFAPIVLHLGSTATAPYPIDLAAVGVPTCFLLTNPVVPLTTTTDGSGKASFALTIPASSALIGGRLFQQFVQLGGILSSISTSNGGRIVIGPVCP